jgi:hypothetical protein
MSYRDAELTDVVVVLEDLTTQQTEEVVKQLKTFGLDVASVNDDQSIVEGTIESHKVHDLKSVEKVRYVRSVMTYSVDYPKGHPKDRNGNAQ